MKEENRRRSEIKLRKDRTKSKKIIETGRLEFCEGLTKKLLVLEDPVLTVPEQNCYLLIPTDNSC